MLHLVRQLGDDLETLERDEEHAGPQHEFEGRDRGSHGEAPRRTRLEQRCDPEAGDEDDEEDLPQRQSAEGADGQVDPREVRDRREREDRQRDEANLERVRAKERCEVRGADEFDEEHAETEGAQTGSGHVAAPRQPSAQETTRRRQCAPHPDVRASGGVGPTGRQLRIRHAGESRDERGDSQTRENEGTGDRIRGADEQENRGADHRADGGHRDVEQAEVPRDPHADGCRWRAGARHAGAQHSPAT